MKLHWSPRSPFVRKVMIVLHEAGEADRVELVRSPVAMAAQPNADVLKDNPLGKIPTLVLDDGRALFDSRVICDFLAKRAGILLSSDEAVALRQKRWEALGDGLTDLLLLWRIERSRANGGDPVIAAGFEAKVRACLAMLEREAAELEQTPLGLGQVAIFCALGQLEFRWPGTGWTTAFPGLARWFSQLGQRPAFAVTAVVDDAPSNVPPVEAQPAAFTFERA